MKLTGLLNNYKNFRTRVKLVPALYGNWGRSSCDWRQSRYFLLTSSAVGNCLPLSLISFPFPLSPLPWKEIVWLPLIWLLQRLQPPHRPLIMPPFFSIIMCMAVFAKKADYKNVSYLYEAGELYWTPLIIEKIRKNCRART